MIGIAGKRALVTGGTSGIGLAIVRALTNASATVLVNSEDETACEHTVALVRTTGGSAQACPADAGDPKAVARLIDQALAAGEIDLLFCNAGVAGAAGPMHQVDEASVARTMAINLHAPRLLCAGLVPPMAARGRGSVVITSSLAGLRGTGALGIYGITKAAVAQLARNLAVEWGPRGVRANAISPGLIATGWEKPILADPAAAERRMRQTPLRRVGQPEEVAAAALFLASDAASFITGHNLVVDGGTIISDGS